MRLMRYKVRPKSDLTNNHPDKKLNHLDLANWKEEKKQLFWNYYEFNIEPIPLDDSIVAMPI